jgi:general secretion pathway protein G
MKNQASRGAFTMIELVFVIVVVGILAGIAIPKFAATRDDAIVSKARATIGSVRSALSMERQKRILRGDFNTTLQTPSGSRVFVIKANNQESNLTEYPVKKCPASGTKSNCWERRANDTFIFHGPGGSCVFKINSQFHFVKQPDCNVSGLSDL